ncbi:unnamed protein product [Ectocarpus fasciculatus]
MSVPLGQRARRRREHSAGTKVFVTSLLLSCLPAFCTTAFVVPAPAATGSFCGECGNAQVKALARSDLKRPLPYPAHSSTSIARDGGASRLQMLWSGGRRTQGNEVTVNIERTSRNSRRISGSIVINRPIEDVWLTLTDYDRLAKYVPNLTQSKVKPSNDGGIRLWQEGAQKIVGFDFRASVEMFMEEHFGDPENRMAQRKLTFGLLDSRMFNEFDGEWRMQFNSRKQFNTAQGLEFQYTTKLFYMVHIRPKGPVPVLALEWQISNEVPNNLSALKLAAEAVTPEYVEMRRKEREQEAAKRFAPPPLALASSAAADEREKKEANAIAKGGAEAFVARGNGDEGYGQPEWESDETLEAYLNTMS